MFTLLKTIEKNSLLQKYLCKESFEKSCNSTEYIKNIKRNHCIAQENVIFAIFRRGTITLHGKIFFATLIKETIALSGKILILKMLLLKDS